MLFLETSQLPIKYITASRRILYLQNILKRHEDELIKRVYYAMRTSPLKRDWSNTVIENMQNIGLDLSEGGISQISKIAFKTIVKSKMRQYVLNELNTIKLGHNKVNRIEHSSLKVPQKYLTSNKFTNKQKSLLFNLRCKSQSEFLRNFSSSNQTIPCKICQGYEDSQEHAILCEKLRDSLPILNRQLLEEVNYSDLFSNIHNQLRITNVYQLLIDARERIRDTP